MIFDADMMPARPTGDVRPRPIPGQRCALCPTHEAHPCPGVRVRRLCDLIDPAHGAYRPEYRESIPKAAAQAAMAEADRIIALTQEAMRRHPKGGGGCGGCP